MRLRERPRNVCYEPFEVDLERVLLLTKKRLPGELGGPT